MFSISSHNTKPRKSARLTVEALEDRSVPAVLDLTTVGASASVNNLLFEQATPEANRAADVFVQLDSGRRISQGYNTNARPQYDEVNARTHAVRMNDLTPLTANNVVYRVIQLNVNERNRNPLISLDELRLYVANTGNLSNYRPSQKTLGGRAPIFDMGDNQVILDARNSGGRQVGDMYLYIPQSILTAGGDSNPFVYVYSKFGVTNPNTGGVEMWGPAVGVVPPPPPPPSNNAAVTGFVFRDENNNGLRDDGTSGIRDVTIMLVGTTDDGDQVQLQVETAGDDGAFSFSGLEAGDYTLIEVQPQGYNNGTNTAGNVNGEFRGTNEYDSEAGHDLFFDLRINANENVVDFLFAEVVAGGGGDS
jgi:hypothetical protein